MDSGEPVCSPSEHASRAGGEGGFRFHSHWNTIPQSFVDIMHKVPNGNFYDPILYPPTERLLSMDGVSKCWKSVVPDAESLLQDEPSGITWAICEECATQIPLQIQHALFFFHSLQAHIQNLHCYAAESKCVKFKRERTKPNTISKLIWTNFDPPPISAPSEGGITREVDVNSAMYRQAGGAGGGLKQEVKPLKIRLAFTGVHFKMNGETHRRVFAVLFVTFARNFDALEYIKEVFLKDPSYNDISGKAKNSSRGEMKMIWNTMLAFVAYGNLGVDAHALGSVEDYYDNPDGLLGVDTLLNMFQIPMQIYRSVRKSLKIEEGGAFPFEEFQIVGLPGFSFLEDDMMDDYFEVMHAHTECMGNARLQVVKAIEKLMAKSSEKKKKKNEEADAEAEEEDIGDAEFFCIGGWPRKRAEDGTVTEWGFPPLPLFLDFEAKFVPDASTNFSIWMMNASGPNGIPEVTKTCLRFFLVSGTDDEDEGDMCWNHFLHANEPADPSKVLQKYYGEQADPMSAMMLAGYLRPWWMSLMKDFESERSLENPVSVTVLSKKLGRYLQSVLLHHESSMACNAFQSERVTQAAQIVKMMEWDPLAREGEMSISKYMERTRWTMSCKRRFDTYQVANELFWKTFEHLNKSFMMNSSNLESLIEMMISQVFWMAGEHNTTWAAYFQGMQIKSGNGHYKVSTPHGLMDDHRKPNSSGMDWTHARLSELYQVILDRFGCTDPKKNLQTPVNCVRWTPASIPLLTSVTVSEGKIDTIPDPVVHLRSMVANEIRDVGISPLIINFPRNADFGNSIQINTCDPDNTNKRTARTQTKISSLQLCCMAGNCLPHSESQNEEFKTLSAVTHCMPPGSAPHFKRQKTGHFNNQTCNAFRGRQSRPDDMDGIANVLTFPNIWTCALSALINRSAAVPFEVNPVVLSYLDWLFFYVGEHVGGIIEPFVMQSFRRMKEGYESRLISKSMWTSAIRDIGKSGSSAEAVIRHMRNLNVNALPVSEVPAVAHSFLTRGIHMGGTVVLVAIAQHLSVPMIRMDSLKKFFDSSSGQDAHETETDRNCMAMISKWLLECYEFNRFCVDEDGNRTCYVSSDATYNQEPAGDKVSMLRVKKNKVTSDNVAPAIGCKIKEVFGSVLNETCHMGPEPSAYGHAVQALLGDWKFDFRQLFSNHLYSTSKHLQKLGITHICTPSNWSENEPPPMVRQFITRSPNQEPLAYSIGVNVWALLLFVSMGGSTMHPHVVSDIARTCLKEILEKSPQVATPGNTCLVRSFNIETTSTQRIILSPERRPLHFPRPLYDSNFASGGKFTYGKGVGAFMPEDVMHCGFLFSLAKMFKCSIYDIPGIAVYSSYELLTDTTYSIWNATDRTSGYLRVKSDSSNVEVIIHSTDSIYSWGYDWEELLGALGYIVLPMIFRTGALVRHLETNQVGVIVPSDSAGEGSSNWDAVENKYYYLIKDDQPLSELPTIEALTKLIEVGTEMYLDVTSGSGKALQPRLCSTDRDKKYLLVRLNVPGVIHPPKEKVWVTYLQTPISASMSSTSTMSANIMVDPWDLTLQPEDPSMVAQTVQTRN